MPAGQPGGVDSNVAATALAYLRGKIEGTSTNQRYADGGGHLPEPPGNKMARIGDAKEPPPPPLPPPQQPENNSDESNDGLDIEVSGGGVGLIMVITQGTRHRSSDSHDQ